MRLQIDFLTIRKVDRRLVKNLKVIVGDDNDNFLLLLFMMCLYIS